jgi:hypothetical protein
MSMGNRKFVKILFIFLIFASASAQEITRPEGQVFRYGLIIVVLLLLTGTITLLNYLKDKHDYRMWDEFKSYVMNTRVSLGGTFPVPVGAGFPDIETWYDKYAFPLNPSAKLKITACAKKLPPQLPATRLVALGFTTSVPAVFSRSVHNLHTGVRTRVVRYVTPPEPGVWDFFEKKYPELSIINLEIGIHYPVPIEKFYYFDGEDHTFDESSYTWEKYLERYPPKRRKYMERLKQRADDGEYKKKHLVSTAFIKKEKQMIIRKTPYEAVKPRVILGVSEPDKIMTGLWFWLFSCALKFSWNPSYWIWYSSGYYPRIFNAWFDSILAKFGNDVLYVVSDFSTYDLTQGKRCMEREWRTFSLLGFVKNLKWGKYFRAAAMRLKIYGQGIKVELDAIRTSGSNPTSSGNSKNTGEFFAFFLLDFLKPYRDFFLAVLGDDNFGIFRKSKVISVFGSVANFKQLLLAHATRLGYKLKVLVTDKILDAEYLSTKFYPTREGHKIGKKPGRCLCKLGWFLTKVGDSRTTNEWLGVLLGTMKSYLPTGNHVPFLRVYLKVITEYISKYHPKVKAKKVGDELYKPWLQSDVVYEADDLTWDAFYEAYGLNEDDELEFEKEIKEGLKLYGLPMILDSYYVDILFNKELVL